MPQESLTLYKLMILYMLDHLDFPLTTAQLSDFFVKRGYSSYFPLQQSINELVDGAFIEGDVRRNITSYHLTDNGKEALELFEQRIPRAIRDDMTAYLQNNGYQLRETADITADYSLTRNGDYMVNVQIREKSSILLELNLNVATEDQAIAVCDRWQEKCQNLYDMIVKELLL